MKVHHVACGPAVNESERTAIDQIKTRLISEPGDDEWWLLTNLAFSATHRVQSDEIDIVALGPPGAQVIEVKHWTAAWVNRNSGLVEHEADRVSGKARKIGTTLRRHVPNLPHVDGAILVTGTSSKVKSLESGKTVRGIPFHTLRTWKDAVGLNARSALSPKQVNSLVSLLQPPYVVSADGALKKLAGYTQLQLRSAPDERFHRVYSAVHASRQDRVMLHLYDLSANDETKALAKAEREWKSLHRLQRYGWAPRIVDSFQDAPGYTNEIKFFTVADPDAPTIEQRTGDHDWDTAARLGFAREGIAALGALHSSDVDRAPMIHRNLTPSTVLVKYDNTPILTGFEHARIPEDVSVTTSTSGQDWHPAVAPEVRKQGLGRADQRSDIYSLCASLTVLFDGRVDETSLAAAEVLAGGTEESPDARHNLDSIETALAKLAGEHTLEPPPPSARFWTEDQLVLFRDHQYRLVSKLGSGGVGTTYKVVRLSPGNEGELGTYVAKVARDEPAGQRALHAYRLAHAHLRHTALSTIFEVASEWTDNNFVALMTWIEGEPLTEYAGVLSILAEDLHEESAGTLALRWLRTVCEGLRVLHDNGLVHGDVSPRNLIVSGNDLVLTDYDCVTKIGTNAEVPGTVLYCSPSRLAGSTVTSADDIFALAASFFHVLFDREPFLYDGVRAPERGLNWEGVKRDEFPLLASFLDRATEPDPEQRFATTAQALSILSRAQFAGGIESDVPDTPNIKQETDSSADDDATDQKQRRENEVPWLKSLLQSYPGSLWGNAETRGLDSEFAANTYIETKLEQALHRAIVQRRVRLVILCGNAGDGKTALLQHLANKLGLGEAPSSKRIVKGKLDDGLMVRMNLDGSASWRGRSADELLDGFLGPFQHGLPEDDRVHLLAINDGRLLEWIEHVEQRDGETELTHELLAFLDEDARLDDSHIRFVNLNRRSLVGGISADGTAIDNHFLDSLVDSLYGGEQAERIWHPCRTCLAQDRCEVWRGTQTFGPGGLADDDRRNLARSRLYHALQAVHLRGETHITVRELRAALVYILFGIHYCDDYHQVAGTSTVPEPQPYSERAFSPGSSGRQGDVLRELMRFDPALDAHPQVDRRLLQPFEFNEDSDLPRHKGLTLTAARRRAWFEWSEQVIERLTGDPYALDLAGGRHLREFVNLATAEDENVRRKVTRRLCAGISRLQTLPPQALDRDDSVALQISPRTPTETAFWVEKPIESFRIDVDLPHVDEGMDRLHRQVYLVYRYQDKPDEVRLRLGAELFHLLLDLSDGYQLGDVATDDSFAHLSIFVQRLVQEEYRRISAWNPMREDAVFDISAKIESEHTVPLQRIVIAPYREEGESHGE